jgi:hypothetical protein
MTAPEVPVRRFEARDLEGVVDLYRESFIGAALRPRAEVQRKLAQLFVDGPYCEATVPSLVVDDPSRGIVAFRGRLRRSWRLGQERLLGSTTTGLMVKKELRRSGIGKATRQMTRRIEAETGVVPDLGWSDRTTPDGQAYSASANDNRNVRLEQFGFDWMLPLRPRALRWLQRLRPRLPEGAPRRLLERAARAAPLEATPSTPARALRSAPLSPAALREAIEAASLDGQIRIDEPQDTLAWLLAYLGDYPSRGTFSGRVWLDERGDPLGFSAGYTSSAGGFELLGFAARPDVQETALRQVLHDAHAARALFVSGTACARELRVLLELGAQPSRGAPASLRTSRTDVKQRFDAMDVLLTGLEGERWL